MLDTTPFFAAWPPRALQTPQVPTSPPQVADFRSPSANGVDPTRSGWVYVKVHIWRGICKVGYTDGQIADRLIETGEPELALHAAFNIPGNYAFDAEQHCHNRLGRRNMIPHVMSGRVSEFFPGPVEHITHQVARAVKEYYDHVFLMLDWDIDVDSMRYDPVYDPRAVSQISSIQAPYWSRKFGLEGLHQGGSIFHGSPSL